MSASIAKVHKLRYIYFLFKQGINAALVYVLVSQLLCEFALICLISAHRPVAVDPKLVGNYSGIAIATFISGCFFYILFYKRDRIGKATSYVILPLPQPFIIILKLNIFSTS